MNPLIRRLSTLERLEHGGVQNDIIVMGGIPDSGPWDRASAGSQTWRREADESVDDFKHRVAFTRRGNGAVVWGGLPE